MRKTVCVYACVFKHTHTPVHTENLSLELMHKKLVATKYRQGGRTGINREENSPFTVCTPFSVLECCTLCLPCLFTPMDKTQNKSNTARPSCWQPMSSLNRLIDAPINLTAPSARNTVSFKAQLKGHVLEEFFFDMSHHAHRQQN